MRRTTSINASPISLSIESDSLRLPAAKKLTLRVVALLLAAGLVFLFTVNWNAWLGAARMQSTDDAYLESDVTPLAARVSGYMRAVAVKDFQPPMTRNSGFPAPCSQRIANEVFNSRSSLRPA
jgi:hypothetical protein